MSNNQIVAAIINRYGVLKAIDFCNMSAHIYKIQAVEFSREFPNEPNEYEYEKDWFTEEGIRLSKEYQKSIQNDRSQIPETRSFHY